MVLGEETSFLQEIFGDFLPLLIQMSRMNEFLP